MDQRRPGGDRLPFRANVTGSVMLGSVIRYRIESAGVPLTLEAVNHNRRLLQTGEEVALLVSRRNLLGIAK